MKAKRNLRGYGTILLFALAATLLIFSTAGSSRAALTYYSETYGAQVSMQDIGVTLVENGAKVASRDYSGAADGNWNETEGALLENMVAEGEQLQPGRAYPEALAVTNSGNIDEYVRVTVYRYWVDTDKDQKTHRTDLDPGFIELALDNSDQWLEDEKSRTPERTVLYYKNILGQGATTDPFSSTLTIKSLEGVNVTVETKDLGDGKYETTYTYDKTTFVLRVDVDAVQTHNAAAAIKSAWGVNVALAGDGSISGVSY